MYSVHLILPRDVHAALAAEAGGYPVSLIQRVLARRMPPPPVDALDWSGLLGTPSTDGKPGTRGRTSGPLGYILPSGADVQSVTAPEFRTESFGATATGLARIQAKARTRFPDDKPRVAMMRTILDALATHVADPAATWVMVPYPWGLD